MIKKLLTNNLYFMKRYCHHHSRTFPKEQDWQRIGETSVMKFQIDKLKVKTDNLSYDIYKLKNINTIQNISIMCLVLINFFK